MKKILVTALIGAVLGFSAVSFAAGDHPNLRAAHDLVVKAMESITAAQKANKYDMKGHAQKAKDLLKEAEGQLKIAVGDANANAKKK